MTSILAPGQSTNRDYRAPDGRVVFTVNIQRDTEGVSIQISGHPTLDRTFTNLQQGRDYLTLLRDEAASGSPVWLIEAMAGAYTSTAAVFDQAEQDLVDRINADLDERRTERQNNADQLAAAVEDALGPDRQAHTTWRDRTRKQVMVQANIGRYAHGNPNQRTRHLPVEAMKDVHLRALLATNDAGEIRVGSGVASTTLRILAEAGYGRTVAGVRRYEIAKLQLNLNGLNALAQVRNTQTGATA